MAPASSSASQNVETAAEQNQTGETRRRLQPAGKLKLSSRSIRLGFGSSSQPLHSLISILSKRTHSLPLHYLARLAWPGRCSLCPSTVSKAAPEHPQVLDCTIRNTFSFFLFFFLLIRITKNPITAAIEPRRIRHHEPSAGLPGLPMLRLPGNLP